VVTFGATLVLSIPTAVATGVALTVVLFVVSSASDTRVRALERREDGEIVVVDPPEKLPSRSVTVLDVYGSLFFAAVRRLRESLPSRKGPSGRGPASARKQPGGSDGDRCAE
jgi:sulfate permease, SulP family